MGDGGPGWYLLHATRENLHKRLHTPLTLVKGGFAPQARPGVLTRAKVAGMATEVECMRRLKQVLQKNTTAITTN